MKVKVSELQGAALDWAVAQCEYVDVRYGFDDNCPEYSTIWAHGGPIIEREKIGLSYDTERFGWVASFYDGDDVFGGTLLIAAMRCYVTSKLGDEIEVPEELLDK